MAQLDYLPQPIFSRDNETSAHSRVFTSPGKYIQGPGVLAKVGRYLSTLNLKSAGVLASKRGHRSEAPVVVAGLEDNEIANTPTIFGGECSLEEIEARASELKSSQLDCLIILGGGKCVDAGKCIAHRLEVPAIVIPTLASNDAPCSALSVVYAPSGVFEGVVEFFPSNPAMVIVDTEIVAKAPERFLVAGMGDAMATWYEAKVCVNNPEAVNMLGSRPTLAACAMGEICAHTLYADSLAAVESIHSGQTSESLERVVEANTLLSGLGFESGGLAAAHAVAQAYTNLPVVEENYLHGEMVAMGLLTQLALEQDEAEAKRATEYFASVGLPIHYGQLSLDHRDSAVLDVVVEATMNFGALTNLPFDVNSTMLRDAVLSANELGLSVAGTSGDEAYRRLQAS